MVLQAAVRHENDTVVTHRAVARTTMRQKDLTDYSSSDCPTCGETFDSPGSMRRHHANGHGISLAKVTLTCERCGDTFERNKSHVGRGDHTYCSRQCSAPARNEKLRRGEEKECSICGTERYVTRADIERHDGDEYFCSQDCANSRVKPGPDAPNWKGGNIWRVLQTPGDLRRGWDATRARIIRRDNHCCQWCDTHDDELDNPLEVHHIIPIRAGGVDSDDLLLTLCDSCHRSAEIYTQTNIVESHVIPSEHR